MLHSQLKRLFVIRLVSATSLYLLLANANTLFTRNEHAVLFGGYRLLLIFAPIFTLLLKTWAMFCLLIGASIASFYCIYETNLFAIFMLALGLSCGGFLTKKHAAETLRSAGCNKWALTFGHIASGFFMPHLLNNKAITFVLVGLLLAFSAILSMFSFANASRNEKVEKKCSTHAIQPTQCIAWTLFGVAIGIRVTSLLMIMPQYLLTVYNVIPNWYGMVLSIYGLMVILAQIPAVFKTTKFSFFQALLALLGSCLILALPSLFYVHTRWGALLWLAGLAIEEVFAPYIDVEASVRKTLLYKEIGTGIGACLSVYLMRTYQSPWFMGSIGLVGIVLAYSLGITRTRSLQESA